VVLNLKRLTRLGAATRSDERGIAAIEFAFFSSLLSFALLNVTDVAIYIYQRMQVENATEIAAQAAYNACDLSHIPATTNCPGLTTAIQTALQSTSLGTQITLQASSPSEGYYCINSSNTLQLVSDVSSRPADCSAAGTSNLQPADYIQIQTSFSYKPLFPGLTVTSPFPTPILKTAMMRLG
jgi:Flp pilus assembly protein TadG